MSAIFGIYYLDGRKAEVTDLERMSKKLAHRGSDGVGLWSESSVGFGHRMLWITPESLHEKLPFSYSNNGTQITITADARLDNRVELIQIFGISGRPHEQITDNELILHAYNKWGEDCPEKLLGDFSFAIWDKRRQRLFCARDHFGIKPFFYYFAPNRLFVFASEIKALLCLPEIPQKLNEIMVADYLAQIYEDKWITFYKEILRLPPAHRMIVERQKVTTGSYWSLDPSREIKLSSDEEYEETFRHHFTESVRTRLRSAFPVGSMLSGGMDSSSIACVARNLLGQDSQRPLHTFSFIFDDVSDCDERPYIHSALTQEGFDPHYIFGDRVSPLFDLDQVQWVQDEPYWDPTLSMSWTAYQSARKENVRMILDGTGGDEATWCTFAFLTEFAHAGRWKDIITELQESSKLKRTTLHKKIKILWTRCIKPFIPEKPKKLWRWMCGRHGKPLLFNRAILNHQFSKRIHFAERSKILQRHWSKAARTLREEQYFYLTYHLKTLAIELADRATQAFSIEHRYPFCDKRLVEFCLALPPEQKFRNGWTRS
ncbi:MAG TPA: lasso peptide isopeptide bond-forming cyclase, partial [bacterium]|nr:lasso peptide isopeptide bond-forming cyclase [bacterium]